MLRFPFETPAQSTPGAFEFSCSAGLQLTNYVIAPESTVGKYGKISKLARHAEISYAFAYVFAMFAASPAPIMESTRGGGRRPPPLWRRPKAASIMGAGEAANIAKTQANAYEISACLANLPIFPYFPTVDSGAIT